MITVQILINGNVILARSARCLEINKDDEWGPAEYTVDDGRKLTHTRRDGAATLAIKMLEPLRGWS